MLLKYQRKKFDFAEDANQHLWAVSYSDMLMLLISFFVIYFEIADSKKVEPSKYVDPLTRIILALKGGAGNIIDKAPNDKISENTSATLTSKGENVQSISSAESVTKTVDEKNLNMPNAVPTKDALNRDGKPVGIFALVDILKKQNPKLNLKTNELMREIVVDFPEDAFSKGGFEVKSGLKNDLKLVLSKILPFKDEVTLNFIGHTDTVPLKKRNETNKIINSNLILSNLRAGRAAELAIQMSFQPEFISSQGVAEYSRNTRSLSLSIRARSASDSKEKTK